MRTYGTKLASKHAEFSSCFLKDCTDCCEYSQPSLLLKTLFSEEGLPLLRWYWNTYHPEWVPLTDTVIEKLKTLYAPAPRSKARNTFFIFAFLSSIVLRTSHNLFLPNPDTIGNTSGIHVSINKCSLR